jgi:hypothetical protein
MTTSHEVEHQLTFAAARAAAPQRFHESQKRGAAATVDYWQQPKPPEWLDCDAAEFIRLLERGAPTMTREVIAKNGFHYRLKPGRPDIVQVQDTPGARYRTHMICRASGEYSAEEIAAAVLAMMGHLSPPAKGRIQDVPEVQP